MMNYLDTEIEYYESVMADVVEDVDFVRDAYGDWSEYRDVASRTYGAACVAQATLFAIREGY